jgi:hypothetical protein
LNALNKILFEKLRKNINKYLVQNGLQEITDQDTCQLTYKLFKGLLHFLWFVDMNKSNPMEMSLVSDLWVVELNCKNEEDICSARNVLTLLAGIQDIKLPLMIMKPEEYDED